MRFLPLEKLINLTEGYRRTVKVDALEVLLIHESGQLYIIQSRCPHRGQSLEAGEIEGNTLYCPWHNFGFDLGNGAHEAGLCEGIKVYQPVYENNLVGILVDD